MPLLQLSVILLDMYAMIKPPRCFRISAYHLFVSACLWSLQIQLLTQIIVNRLALLMPNPIAVTRLRWVVFFLILLVNISVMVTWVPAQLQISSKWTRISEIWERCEMAIFSIIDISLNLRSIQLVRSRLVSHGLNNKYLSLFQFNCGMILVSISLDVSRCVYIRNHPEGTVG